MGALLVSCASSTQVPVIANSSSIGNISFNNSNTNAEQPSPKEPPVRIMKLPADTAETMYFRGVSVPKRSSQEALKDAEKDAQIRVSGYIGSFIEGKVEDAVAYQTSMGKVVEDTEKVVVASSSYTKSVLSRVKTIDEQVTPPHLDGTVEVRIVVAVDKKLLDKAIDDFKRLQDAAKTVRFIPDSSTYTGQKGVRIEIPVGITATTAIDIGALECVFTYGNEREVQSITVGNTVRFHIDTARLPAGTQTGLLELQMQKLSPGIENVRLTVSFEVTPLNTVRFLFHDKEAEPLGAAIQGIFQAQGLLSVETDAAYFAIIKLELSERKTVDYSYIKPVITIRVELERDQTPVLTYTKKYDEFSHRTRDAALERVYRNIENDLASEFTAQIRSLGT
jgi:hypothetical protein